VLLQQPLSHFFALFNPTGAFMTPDVTAPGVNIYAPVSKKQSGTANNFFSGTSA
jgi:hypothetical protein